MNDINIPNLTKRELEGLACLESTQLSAASIAIKADDGRTYLFATYHYLDGVREANFSKDTTGSGERLILRFTTGEVVMLGSRLERIEERLAEGRLRGLKTIASRYASALETGPIILSITVTRKVDV
ncbi:MAG: hypothetical protein ACR2OZ_17040 [Verrucomicrobiales bacterium]